MGWNQVIPINILLIQMILPPYRLPFFQKLANSPLLNLTIAYGRSFWKSDLESIENPDRLKVYPLRNYYLGRKAQAAFQKGFLNLLRRERFEVIIAEFNPRIISNIIVFLYSRIIGNKFIWWGHGTSPNSTDIIIRFRILLISLADALICYDAVQAEKFISLGVPREKVFVASNAIDTEEIIPLVSKKGLPERHRILFIGRLVPEKKVDLLIRSFFLAQSQLKPGTKLTIIGDGQEREKLENLAKEYSIIEKIEFLGSIYSAEMLAPWFNSAWVSVSPGQIGLSAIHSLAFGLPMIVARNEPHGPERAAIEEDINTTFFPSDNEKALASQLIALERQPKKWEQMSAAASQKIRGRYSLAAMAEAFEQAIDFAMKV